MRVVSGTSPRSRGAVARLALGGAVSLAVLGSLGCAASGDRKGDPSSSSEVELAASTDDVPAAAIDDAAGAEGGEPAGTAEPAEGVLATVGGIVERAQRDASERFDAFMFELDDFFAGDLVSDEPNTSYVRLRLDALKPALDSFEVDPSLKLRVVLPRSEQRLRLLFSTGDEPGEGDRDLAAVSPIDRDEQSASLALRFVRRARKSGRLDFDIGARQREGSLQVFGRVNAEYRDDIGERGNVRLSNRWFYYSKSGFEDRLRLDLTRSLGADRSRFLRSSSTANWRRDRKGASLGQVFGLYADLGDRAAIAVEALAGYDTSLNGRARDRYRGHEVRVRFRRNVWRPWLYYELWPAVAWPAEREYRRTWNGLLRLEASIGGESTPGPVSNDAPVAAPAVPDQSDVTGREPFTGPPVSRS